ncbi:hypothetical protein [Cohnella kolymensis]|uniref:hypothetical protein n=1 Tax=Cohnella kolymensis TaxID=1590652 RepID=UPI0006989A57|nr:hypothetical protein [Cohnella kolymensis]
MFESLSVLIPYKPDHGHRDLLFNWVQRFYAAAMPEAEICIGHDVSELFNKSKAVNLAASQAARNVYLIADADVFFDPAIIIEAMKQLDSYAWVIPFREAINVAENNTKAIVQSEAKWPLAVEASDFEVTAYYEALPAD